MLTVQGCQGNTQRGAILVLALIMMGAVTVAWKSYTTLSQTILVQAALDQASRAAALGAARWHARLMNAHAMLNRTEMAHQVAMAHLLTLASAWSLRMRMAERVRRGNPPAFLIARFFGGRHAKAYQSAAIGFDQRALTDLQNAFERHDQRLSQQLQRARADLYRDIRRRTELLVRDLLQRNLMHKNDELQSLDVQVHHATGLTSYVRKLDDHNRWQRWMDAVMQRHRYLKSRWSMKVALSPFLPTCPILKHLLIRTGSSEIRVKGYWSAGDTLSFHAVRPLPKWCYFREYPMGWADHKVDALPTQDLAEELPQRSPVKAPDRFKNFRKWVAGLGGLAWNLLYPLNNKLAGYYAQDRRVVWQRRAAAVPYHLESALNNQVITVKVSVKIRQLQQKGWHIRLHQDGLIVPDQTDWPKQLYAQAAAQVFYDRYGASARANRQQAEDLLQPFWQARQAPVPQGL